jgi:proteasome beta subunit
MDEEISKNLSKTGTLTIGLVCKDGIVVAADRRVTYGAQGGGVSYIASTAKKIWELNNQIIGTMAGTVSDALKTTSYLRAEIRLRDLRTKKLTTVSEAASLLANMNFHNIRTPSMIPAIAHFLLAGRDSSGVKLYDVTPDGYAKEIETCVATGSGLMQADSILDAEYKKGMSADEGVKLAIKCIKAATAREPGVGSGADVYVVSKDGIKQVLSQEVVQEFKNK